MLVFNTFFNTVLKKRKVQLTQTEYQKKFDHIASIAAQYGYGPDSDGVKTLKDSSAGAYALINTAFTKEAEWHEKFDPRSDIHVDYRNGVLVVMQFPRYVTTLSKTIGAARSDIVRARLAVGWEASCDRIVVGRRETTFFEGNVPIVIFCGSGRDGWGHVRNAVDAIKTYAGVDIHSSDLLFVNDGLRRTPELVLNKVNDKWVWPTQVA